MRITLQLLRKAAARSPEEATYLDLSGKNIADIERLECCTQLQTLVIRENCLDAVRNIECCRELWNIDLTGNKIRSLHGLSRFPVLGMLVLGYNALEWHDLQRLAHVHLIRLTLAGNGHLDCEPHYRKHVVHLLPNLWMLDGQLITAGERKEVKQFFKDTAASAHPVRPKGSSETFFIPSNLKNLLVTGVFGERTTHMMSRFPLQCSHNIDLDRKRLTYLSYCMEKDLELKSQYLESRGQISFRVPQLQRLLELRASSVEQCNMLLLLLIAKLEFNLPLKVMDSTLETARLSHIDEIVIGELFQLPDSVALDVVSLLLSAAALDRDASKTGGLYDQLYKCLQFMVYLLQKKVLAPSNTSTKPVSTSVHSSSSSSSLSSSHLLRTSSARKARCASQQQQLQYYHSLLASEVVHLMCLVPAFFDGLLENNKGVTELAVAATRNSQIGSTIGELSWKVHSKGGDVWDLYHDIASYLLHEISTKILSKNGKFPNRPQPVSGHSVQRTTSQLIPPQAGRRQTRVPKTPRALSAGAQHSQHKHQPGLGDLVMCTPQKLARIVALPEGHVAVLQLSSPTASTAPQDAYFYVDTRGLVWNSTHGYWSGDDLSSELSSSLLIPSSPELSRRSAAAGTASLPGTRPHSQMSNYSEELHTLPSVEEMSLEEELLDDEVGFHVSVNITDRGNTTPSPTTRRRPYTPEQLEEVKLQHQTHVLQQYKVKEEKPPIQEPSSPVDRTVISPSLASLTVPTPQLSLPTTWQSKKSIVSSRPTSHACERDRRTYTPSPPPKDRDTRVGSTVDLTPFSEHRPVAIVEAWAPVASPQPKGTILTATRIKTSATNEKKHNYPPNTSVKSEVRVKSSSSSLSSSRPCSRQGSAVVLHPRSATPTRSSHPVHMSAYLQHHSHADHGRHRFQPKSTASGKSHSTRKLGDLRHLSMFPSAAW